MAAFRGAGRQILVVEDDPTNRVVLARQLAIVGIAAEMAVDGEEGLRRWREGNYDLVLSDLHMPVRDGFGLVRAIRAEEAGRRRTPVLAFSADVRVGQAERVREAGFDAFLTKPLQLDGLRDALTRWCTPGVQDGADVVAATAAAPGGPDFDAAALRELVGDEPALLVEIVEYFGTVAADMRAELLAAAAAADGTAAVELAHRLKSSARSVGAHPLGALCEALEAGGGHQPPAVLQDQAAGVVAALDAALAAMGEWRGRQAAPAQWKTWSEQ